MPKQLQQKYQNNNLIRYVINFEMNKIFLINSKYVKRKRAQKKRRKLYESGYKESRISQDSNQIGTATITELLNRTY